MNLSPSPRAYNHVSSPLSLDSITSSPSIISTFYAIVLILAATLTLSGCTAPLNQRVIYETTGMQVGVESDHTINRQAIPPILNDHPSTLTPEEIRTLLGSLEVSGWTGILVGIFETPHPKPVFGGNELGTLAVQFAKAFREATPQERIYFSLQNPTARYETDRTAGSMFIRDGLLHFILRDHYGFEKADPGGGEQRDPRDTKGMRLWVTRPAHEATVPEVKQPLWSSFDKVHISLDVKDVLTALGSPSEGTKQSTIIPTPAAVPQAPVNKLPSPASGNNELLQQQVQELGNANQQLRTQFEQQTTELDKLKEELRRLRDDLKSTKSSNSTPDRKPSRKKPTQ